MAHIYFLLIKIYVLERHKLASTRELKYIVIIPAGRLADVGIMISTTMK